MSSMSLCSRFVLKTLITTAVVKNDINDFQLFGSIPSSFICLCNRYDSLAFIHWWSRRFQSVTSSRIRPAPKQTLSCLFFIANYPQWCMPGNNIKSKCSYHFLDWRREWTDQFNDCGALDN